MVDIIQKIKKQAEKDFDSVVESLNKKNIAANNITSDCKWGGSDFSLVSQEVDFSIGDIRVHNVTVSKKEPVRSMLFFWKKPGAQSTEYVAKLDVSMSVYYLVDGFECLGPFYQEDICIRPGKQREIKKGTMEIIYNSDVKITSIDESSSIFILFG